MKTIEQEVDGVMAGAGAFQAANGEWVASCGIFGNQRGHGKTSKAATAALRQKVESIIRKRLAKGAKK
jgi:hypothetical protein